MYFKFDLQEKSHTVVQLPVHLKDSNFVYFDARADPDLVLTEARHMILTWFVSVCENVPDASDFLYQDVCHHFTWVRKHWVPRNRGGDKAIARMVWCNPLDIKPYFLRIMLCFRSGPKSFEDFRTVFGVLHDTYKDAALASGHLEDGSSLHRCMSEA